jgi:hypothetical protein
MRWPWQKRDEVEKITEHLKVLEMRLAEIEAKGTSANLFAFAVFLELTEKQREGVLEAFRKTVGQRMGDAAPYSITEEYQQAYRNELSRLMQAAIKSAPQSN